MCVDPVTIAIGSAGLSAFGSYKSAKSERAQLKAQAKAAEYDAKVAEQNARDALFRGELAAQDVARGARQLRGAQRAAFAGAGVDVNVGTAMDIQEDTTFFGGVDVARTRYNAANEALGLRQQGERSSQQAGQYREARSNINPLFNAATSLVGKLAPVADKWYQGRTPVDTVSTLGGGYSARGLLDQPFDPNPSPIFGPRRAR